MDEHFQDRYLAPEQMELATKALTATVSALRGGKHSGHAIEPDVHEISLMIVEYIMRGKINAEEIGFNIAAHYADVRANGPCSLKNALID